MTRETKIGLLVGLAFIIVVAILLTDHTTTATDPRPAALPDVGSNVRQSVAAPAGPAETVRAEAPRADAARADAPRSPIPTRADLAGDPAGPPVVVASADAPAAGGPKLPPMDAAPPARGGGGKPAAGGPADLVARHPDDLVFAGDPAAARAAAIAAANNKAGNKPAAPAPVTPSKTYVAEAGDSVSRIAAKTMAGGGTKANREALVKANPSLQAEGNPVFVGRSYVIPSPGAVAQAGDPAAGAKPVVPIAAPPFQAPPAPASAAAWYTVKENDNLWRIAARELGDGNRWTQIKDLNKDLLRGGETVKANMRIRLPKAATVTASAN